MPAMTPRTAATAALLALTLVLGACSGGGSSPGGGTGTSPGPGTSPDQRPGELHARADTLLLSGLHARWSLAGGGETIADSYVEGVTCSGARCVAADGTVTTARDLLDPSTDPGTVATTGTRGGFDTVVIRGSFAFTETLPELALTVSPEVTSFGFWGAHGFAALALGDGRLAAEIGETAFSGEFASAQAWVAGDATGTNPAGTGSATWRGIAEASPVGAFERLTGTATLTIADLSRPRVGVAIEVPGHAIGAPGWADMALAGGRFASGTAGTDYLRGGFHGPGHEEAWGVFDTTGYIGAFGAKRTP